ncbi:MAG TPA: bifunctional NADH-specific enoyl-ACP reductase/trans-2-enoyl-CoA reductase [Micromonospora sp.]
MIVRPVLRRGVCLTAHPDGCAERVRRDIARAASAPMAHGPSVVLVIGSSSGLGLAARIYAAFGCGAATVGVYRGRPATRHRTATAGWYNARALRAELDRAGLWARDVIGDAFADDTKQRAVAALRTAPGPVEVVIHSVATSRRTDPCTGTTYRSTIAAVGKPYTELSYDVTDGSVRRVTLPAASPRQVAETVAVMGGDDWQRWIETLDAAGVLAPHARTVAFTYVGPAFLARSYRLGTLGAAKRHVERTATRLHDVLAPRGGGAYAAAASALITPASAVIPIQSLYTVLLTGVLGERGPVRDPLDQARDLFHALATGPVVDGAGRIRLDGADLAPEVQAEVRTRWTSVTSDNVAELGGNEYRARLLAAYGFGIPGVDYERPVNPMSFDLAPVGAAPISPSSEED